MAVKRRPNMTNHRRPRVTHLSPPPFPGSHFAVSTVVREREGDERTGGVSGVGGCGSSAAAGGGFASSGVCPGSCRPVALAPGGFGSQRDERSFLRSSSGAGRGGAIDLVVHVRGCRPMAAIRWLAGLPALSTPTPEAPVRSGRGASWFVPPRPCEGNWPRVRAWLLYERGFETSRVDALFEAGLLHADARCNAVFLCRDARGRVTGAELVGTGRMADGRRFLGLASGTRNSAGGFRIGPEATGLAEGATFLAESAIDAVSALSLGVGGRVRMYASTAGVCRRLPDWL